MGYCSLTCSGIHYELEGVRQTLPAIEIKYFAIDSRYQKLRFDDIDDDGAHFYLSDKLLCDMIQICQTIAFAFSREAFLLSCAWIALSIFATILTLNLGTTEKILR